MDRARTLVSVLAIIAVVGLFWSARPASAWDNGPTDYRYRNDPYLRHEPPQVGTIKKLVPGVLGAVVGGYFGGHFGIVGRVIGGVAGYYVGNYVGKMLFPNRYYDDYDNYPWYYNQQRRYQVNDGIGFSLDAPTFAPQAPQILDAKLSSLRETYFRTLSEYQNALTSGNEPSKKAAKAAYEEAYRVYSEAKKSSLGN